MGVIIMSIDQAPTPFEFPILYRPRKPPNAPESIPWEWLIEHEEQAKRNHRQSLERLAERGGLSPMELYAVMHDLDYGELRQRHYADDFFLKWLFVKVADDEFDLG